MAPPAELALVRRVAAEPRRVWRALTDPAEAAGWLGALEGPLAVGELARLRLLDGDFFLLEPTVLAPPATLAYQWAPMGVGVEHTITWRLDPDGGGCRVIATDAERERTEEHGRRDADQLRVLLDRLARFCARGPLGPVCRDAFDAGIELAATLEGVTGLLLDPALQARWLPLDEAPLTPVGERGARRLRIDVPPGGSCVLEAGPRRHGAMVSIHHEGFGTAAPDVAGCQAVRRRWCEAWGRAMRRFATTYIRAREAPAIGAQELAARVGEPGWHIYDTNVPARWEEGHIAGATHLGPEPPAAEALPADRSATLVFYCLSPF